MKSTFEYAALYPAQDPYINNSNKTNINCISIGAIQKETVTIIYSLSLFSHVSQVLEAFVLTHPAVQNEANPERERC